MLKHEIATAPDTVSVWRRIQQLRVRDESGLAPLFRRNLDAMIEDAKGVGLVAGVPFDPVVFETIRSNELQQIYFDQGTTNARTALYGWHFYGLAADVISASREWSVPQKWWDTLRDLAEAHGLDSGARWKRPDYPHVQWGKCKDSPSDAARQLYFGSPHWRYLDQPTGVYHLAGLRRVWVAVGAAA